MKFRFSTTLTWVQIYCWGSSDSPGNAWFISFLFPNHFAVSVFTVNKSMGTMIFLDNDFIQNLHFSSISSLCFQTSDIWKCSCITLFPPSYIWGPYFATFYREPYLPFSELLPFPWHAFSSFVTCSNDFFKMNFFKKKFYLLYSCKITFAKVCILHLHLD